MYYIDNIVK